VSVVPNPPSEGKLSQNPDTLSILLKEYNETIDSCHQRIELANDLICQSRIKPHWKKRYIKAGDTKTEIELAAYNAANYLENVTKHLSQVISHIESNKTEAQEFAINCFAYLNKIHQGSCIGEAGKIIIDLFKKGQLCSEMMEALMQKAEDLSQTKSLPFANKLNDDQKHALKFMEQEKEERITPVLNSLQTYKHLYSHIPPWNLLLDALIKENSAKAQKIIESMP
jgi:hypothetical protein